MFSRKNVFVLSLILLDLLNALALVAPSSVEEVNRHAKYLFKQFQVEHGKNYSSIEETQKRSAIFHENLLKIIALNKARVSASDATFGITSLADLTEVEFQRLLNKGESDSSITVAKGDDCGSRKTCCGASGSIDESSVSDIPPTIDWRQKGAVTRVGNEGQCGSTWAYAVVDMVESQAILAGHGDNKTTILSVQQIVDCDDQNYGCQGGEPGSALNYIKKYGLELAKDYPYDAKNGQCQYDASKVFVHVSAWYQATHNCDEKELARNVATRGPQTACVNAMKWQFYTGGVMTYAQCACGEDCSLDHCATIVGYNLPAQTPFWILKNQWGTSWGMNGYILVEYGHDNACGIGFDAKGAVVPEN